MKKLLLSMLVAVAGYISANATEIVFDLTDPTAFGYDVPAEKAGTSVTTLVKGDIKITCTKNSNDGARFWGGTNDAIDFRCYTKDVITIASTDGATITGMKFEGGKVPTVATKFSAGTPTYTSGKLCTWEGSATSIDLTIGSTMNWNTLTITTGTAASVAAPTFSVPSGTYTTPQTVAIDCATTGIDDIYYTTDGTDPLTSATKVVYSTPVTITETTTLKAVAVSGDEASSVATAVYTIPVECASIADFNALDANGVGKLSCSLNVAYQNGNYLYVNDGTTWMLVFGTLSHSYNNGDVIPAGTIGKKTVYNGLVEFVPIDASTFAEATAGASIDPEVKTIGGITLDDCSKYAVIYSATISDVDGKNFTLNNGSDQIKAYNQFSSTVTLPTDLEQTYNVVGVISVRNTAAATTPTDLTHLQFLPISFTVSTGVETAAADDVKVIAGAGSIDVLGEANAVEVYTTGGALVSKNQTNVNCAAGLYIVKVNGKASKVVVK